MIDGNVLQGNFRTVGTAADGCDFTVGKINVQHLDKGLFCCGKGWKCGAVHGEGLTDVDANLIIDYGRIDRQQVRIPT